MLRESSIKLDKINEDKLVLSEDLVKNYYMIIFLQLIKNLLF